VSYQPSDESLRLSSLPLDQLASELSASLKKAAGGSVVLSALSGGVDSTVATLLALRAIGAGLRVVTIDTGFLREGEAASVSKLFRELTGVGVELDDEKAEFARSLGGISDAEEKRLAFRETFYQVLRNKAQETGAQWLLQGTIAPDWIETTGGIKTQHNVLGQMGVHTEEKYGFKLLEPLAYLYKDQVRALGRFLGLPGKFVERQPFPGPGLLVRVPGELVAQKLELARRATPIVEEALAPLSPSQYFVAVFGRARRLGGRPILGAENWSFNERVTGVRGDARVYGKLLGVDVGSGTGVGDSSGDLESLYAARRELVLDLAGDYTRIAIRTGAAEGADGDWGYSLVIRAVSTADFMTADVTDVPIELLSKVSSRLLGLDGVADVYYDITPKPPATIEYE
jgi:GMP synthase (glutamine-hydrolysing)